MNTLNLGILAHVDAGKTSLTERLLYAAGVIDTVGSVDDGSTQTDSMSLERQRGITIKSAVVSFAIDDVTVNLIDTPGHPDFIAEVERVLNVLDGAVLVISAVEGVQAQTRILMRTLRRLRIPTLILVNKIDRGGAQYDVTLRDIERKLDAATVPMGSVTGLGGRDANFTPFSTGEPAFNENLVNQLAEHDDGFTAAYLHDEAAMTPQRLWRELAAQVARSQVHPVYFGSAATGAGMASLADGIKSLLPAAPGSAGGPVSGTIFKIERGPAGEKIAYTRLFDGTLRVRDRLRVGLASEAKVTAINVFDHGSAVSRDAVSAGQIARVWGWHTAQIGDTVGELPPAIASGHFAPPTLETVVTPVRRRDKAALHSGLVQLAEQDPLINLRQDDVRQEVSVSLYGEVQKQVIESTLVQELGIDVEFRETTTICIERPVGVGAAVEFIAVEPNPFLATVGLRVEPAPVGSGVRFRLEVELGSMPSAFMTAVEETVKRSLRQGIHGWEVTDCVVTLTHSGYWARQSHAHGSFDASMSSTAGDFRNLTPLVLMDALREARTVVHEPIHRFRLELPQELLGSMLPVLTKLGAVPLTTTVHSTVSVLEGRIPVARVRELEIRLPGLTRGEGLLEYEFDCYLPIPGAVPTRQRSDHNPLNRKEYLLRVAKRVPGP